MRFALERMWLTKALDTKAIGARVESALSSGYLVVGTGAEADDAARIGRQLEALPESLRHIPSLLFAVVASKDADANVEVQPLEDSGQALAPSPLIVALMHLLEAQGRLDPDEVGDQRLHLPAALVEHTRSAAYAKLLSFAVLLQVARHDYFALGHETEAWDRFWIQDGITEALGRIGGDAVNGYAISVAVYAVAPQILADRAPSTFAVLHDRFGSELKPFEGWSTDRAALELLIALADLAATI